MPIFDQGYQHWSGKLSGHGWRWLAITRHGVRVGMKNRFVRYLLYSSWVPALALVTMLSLWGLLERRSNLITTFVQFMEFLQPGMVADPQHFRIDVWRLSYGYFLKTELWFSMIMILLIGPSLISQDLRFNALPLYFSRPLRRMDYFAGKMGVIVAFVGLVMIVPSIVAYIFGLLFSLDITIIRDTFGILLSSILYGLIITLSAGLLILALSALSRSSRYVALFWLGIWFVSGITASILQDVNSQQRRFAYYRQISVTRPSDSGSLSRDERTRQMRAWRQARQRAQVEYRIGELEYSKTDWRPLVSYTSDLTRIGQALLRTNETWQRISLLQADPLARDQLLATYMGPQFPWYWSAGVLFGLSLISLWMLTLSIKSLDRLK
jgi:ABC-2 type transport system permease protein